MLHQLNEGLTAPGSSAHGARRGASECSREAEKRGGEGPGSAAPPGQTFTDSTSAYLFVACPFFVVQGADWLFTAKGAERQIDKILGDYYEPTQSRGGSRRHSERLSPRVALDKIASIIDSRMKQLRRQEDEVSRGCCMCEHVFQHTRQDFYGLA